MTPKQHDGREREIFSIPPWQVSFIFLFNFQLNESVLHNKHTTVWLNWQPNLRPARQQTLEILIHFIHIRNKLEVWAWFPNIGQHLNFPESTISIIQEYSSFSIFLHIYSSLPIFMPRQSCLPARRNLHFSLHQKHEGEVLQSFKQFKQDFTPNQNL